MRGSFDRGVSDYIYIYISSSLLLVRNHGKPYYYDLEKGRVAWRSRRAILVAL